MLKYGLALFAAATAANAEPQLPSCGFVNYAQEMREHGLLAEADNRPPTVAQVESESLPIVIHYEQTVTEAYAREILGYAEVAWRTEFETMGFLKPLPDGELGGDDRLDFYIVTTLPRGVGGYTGFSGFNEATPRQDAIGYVVIANEIDPRIRRFVVAHELFHASQIAYDWWEDLSFMEGSATWIVDHVFSDENIYWRYFPYFNAEPHKALDYISMMNPYQYGSGLFSEFLDERFGAGDGSFIRQLWEKTPQDGTDNEPDFMDAAKELVADKGGIDNAMREFGVWRLLVGSRKAYGKFREVDLWDQTMDPFIEANMPPGVLGVSGSPVNPLQPLSHSYMRFPRPFGENATFKLNLGTEGDTRLAVDWVALTTNGATVTNGDIVPADQEREFTVPAIPNLKELIFIVTNLSTEGYDTDTSPWLGRRYHYTFGATRPVP